VLKSSNSPKRRVRKPGYHSRRSRKSANSPKSTTSEVGFFSDFDLWNSLGGVFFYEWIKIKVDLREVFIVQIYQIFRIVHAGIVGFFRFLRDCRTLRRLEGGAGDTWNQFSVTWWRTLFLPFCGVFNTFSPVLRSFCCVMGTFGPELVYAKPNGARSSWKELGFTVIKSSKILQKHMKHVPLRQVSGFRPLPSSRTLILILISQRRNGGRGSRPLPMSSGLVVCISQNTSTYLPPPHKWRGIKHWICPPTAS